MTTIDVSTIGSKIGLKEFLLLFKRFSTNEQIKIAGAINQYNFEQDWAKLDATLPDTDEISEEEILETLNYVRYAHA
jgi:hypothetical protein